MLNTLVWIRWKLIDRIRRTTWPCQPLGPFLRLRFTNQQPPAQSLLRQTGSSYRSSRNSSYRLQACFFLLLVHLGLIEDDFHLSFHIRLLSWLCDTQNLSDAAFPSKFRPWALATMCLMSFLAFVPSSLVSHVNVPITSSVCFDAVSYFHSGFLSLGLQSLSINL